MSPFVDLSFDGPCAHLTLKRPNKLNALDRLMIDALLDGARAIEASPEARVAILSGEGKAFCAGGDIAAWGALQPLEMWRDWTRAGHRALEALARLRVPLIVVLTGHAFGGGLELAAVGDVRIAESGIRLGLPSPVSAWRRVVRHAEARAALRCVYRTAHGPDGRNISSGSGSAARPR